jgi:hypothetical protein
MNHTAMSTPNVVWLCAMAFAALHTPCQTGLVDNTKIRVLQ